MAGGGIAAIPAFLVLSELERAELIEVLPDWTLGPAPVSVVSSTQEAPSLRVRAYLGFLQETIGMQRPWEAAPRRSR
jgi:LysR family transcriptional regulator for bpeEF and oprC